MTVYLSENDQERMGELLLSRLAAKTVCTGDPFARFKQNFLRSAKINFKRAATSRAFSLAGPTFALGENTVVLQSSSCKTAMAQ